jgi:aspartate/methionine/tyrosine aminotransferase
VVSDEIYEHFIYDGEPFSIGSIYPNTVTMNGFSKEYAMTGWRVGYITGPREIIDAINELQQYVVMSSSSIAQHAALEALRHPPADIAGKYKDKRDLVVSSLKDMGFKVKGADGAFYIFVKAPDGMTDIDFVDRATDNGLIIVPGRAFSQLHGFVRISYGASKEDLVRGLQALQKTVSSLH